MTPELKRLHSSTAHDSSVPFTSSVLSGSCVYQNKHTMFVYTQHPILKRAIYVIDSQAGAGDNGHSQTFGLERQFLKWLGGS
jgi:hypothetical protein